MEIISVAFMKGYDGVRFKEQDIDNEHFYQLPKSLFSYKCYDGLSLTAKVIYAFLKDRMELSRDNGWVEENGDIFLMFSYSYMAELLAISKATVSREFQKLIRYGLIETIVMDKSGAQKIYINRIEPPKSMADVHDYEKRLNEAGMARLEKEAQELVAEAFSRGERISLQEAKAKILTSIKGAKKNNTRFTGATPRFTNEDTRCTGETPRCTGETPRCSHATAPVSPVQHNDTELYSDTDIEILKKEKNNTTTTTGTTPAAERKAEESDPLQQIILSYRENISPMVGPVVTNELSNLCKEYGAEQVNASITEAALSAKGEVNVKYLRAILSRWSKEEKKKAPKAAKMSKKPIAVETDSEPDELYDDEGNPLPQPLPGENALEYFNRVGISI